MSDEVKPAKVANLFVNEQGYVYADGAKICRLTPAGQLEFLHKGHRNSGKRGTKVPVQPVDLLHLVNLATRPQVDKKSNGD